MKACRDILLASGTLPRRQRAQRGMVMIIVLWIAFGLVTAALVFGHSMMFEYRAADNALAGAEASQAIEGARRYVEYVLTNAEEPGRLPDFETYSYEQVPIGEALFWLHGRPTGTEDDSQFLFGLRDEASKLNLNTATREMLEALPGMTTDLAAAIIDWRDEDSELTDGGAESQDYLLLEPGYNAKDSAFETVEELRLVMDMNMELLLGEDTNLNGVLDPNEDDGDESPPADNRDGQLDAGLLEYVTVWSRERNVQADGSARLQVNSNESSELQEYIGGVLGEDRAAQIVAAAGPDLEGIDSVLEFYIRGEVTDDEAIQIDDGLTVSEDDYTTGLVNVNTALAEVLACLPGVGIEYAEQLVAYRDGRTDELNSVAWVRNVLDEEAAIQAGPYLTTHSYQFTVDIAAVGRFGRGFRRVVYIIDTGGESPVVVYRRDRTGMGWSLGEDIRTNLRESNSEQRLTL